MLYRRRLPPIRIGRCGAERLSGTWFRPIKNLPSTWDVKTGAKHQVESRSRHRLPTEIRLSPMAKYFLGTNNDNPKNPAITGDKGVLMCFRESDGKFLWQAVSDKLESAI